jgi:DNA-binding XRE family transcriptional regulator
VEFCDKVKAVREQLLLTQEMLAKEIGVHFSTINRWERDRIEPSIRGKRAFYEYCNKNNVKFN